MIHQELIKIDGDAEYYQQFRELWHEYVADLQRKEPRVADANDIEIYQMFQQEDLDIYFMVLRDLVMGFCVIAKGKLKPKGVSYHISEFYVCPQYRNKGFGSWMARQIRQKYGKTVSLHVLYNNPRADVFWRRVFDDCENISSDYDLSDDLVKGYVFKEK